MELVHKVLALMSAFAELVYDMARAGRLTDFETAYRGFAAETRRAASGAAQAGAAPAEETMDAPEVTVTPPSSPFDGSEASGVLVSDTGVRTGGSADEEANDDARRAAARAIPARGDAPVTVDEGTEASEAVAGTSDAGE